MKEVKTINDYELTKAINKVSKIAKEKNIALKDRTNRKLKIKVKKSIKKVEKVRDEEML